MKCVMDLLNEMVVTAYSQREFGIAGTMLTNQAIETL